MTSFHSRVRMALAAVALAIAVCRPAVAQQQAPRTFEVVSVKANATCQPGDVRPVFGPASARVSCVTLRSLVRVAYGLFSGDKLNAETLEVRGGPAWMDSERYDFNARSEQKATPQEILGPMLREFLANRFQLRIHREQKNAPSFSLTVADAELAKRAFHLSACVPLDVFASLQGQPASPDACTRMRGKGGPGPAMSFEAHGVTMAEFSGRLLSGYAGRRVVDATGMEGRFDFRLEFVPAPPSGPVMLNGELVELPPPDPLEGDSTLFSALKKQLGLKLTPGSAPVEVVVVDRAERPQVD